MNLDDDKRTRSELAELCRKFKQAGANVPPSIKPIEQAPMDITLGAFCEAIKAARKEGAQVAVNACLSMIADNPALIYQPGIYPRRILESAVEEELKDRATGDTAAPEENARR